MANTPLLEQSDGGGEATPTAGVHARMPRSPERDRNEEENDDFVNEWGFELDALYKMAKQFFCQNEGKAFHVSYEDKLKLISYTQQEKYGPYDEGKCRPVGYLDLIGQDRREAWIDLGSMERKTARQEFVALLHDRCPLFRPFVFAHKASLQQKTATSAPSPNSNTPTSSPSSPVRQSVVSVTPTQAPPTLQAPPINQTLPTTHAPPTNQTPPIPHAPPPLPNEDVLRAALNHQTYQQFSQYAAQQCPGDDKAQIKVIEQLQEEHLRQYMKQWAEQTMNNVNNSGNHNVLQYNNEQQVDSEHNHLHHHEECAHSHEDDDDASLISVAEPEMWTRKEIVEFKESIRQEGGDSIIKVGHGETVTVRVPTHDDGQCLYWEFATDHYDIGFGVYFEWTKTPGNTVSVHISDSEDESCDDIDDENQADDDIEAVKKTETKEVEGPPTSVIIPIFRRDCQQEVYAGRHQYPGQGIYNLKFDNSYSMWRGKTLYYRVYYTR